MNIIPRMIELDTGLGSLYLGCEELFYKWLNDSRIYLHMGDLDPFPISQTDALNHVNVHKKDTWFILARKLRSWIPIGYLGIFIRNRHRVGIIRYAIGEALFLGKGHATRAINLALTKLGFQRSRP